MITVERAKEIAKGIISSSSYILVETSIEILKNGWVFHYVNSNPNFKNYNSPLFVDKHNGNAFYLNTFIKDEQIFEYEKKQGYL